MNAGKHQQPLSWFESFSATVAGVLVALLLFGAIAEAYLRYRMQAVSDQVKQNINKGVTKR